MSFHNLEVSTENLLSVVLQMPETEFNQFVEKAKKLRRTPTKSLWTKHEVQVIQKINEFALSTEEQNRFDELVEKRRDEKISRHELEELIGLTQKAESLNVERLKCLVKLAKSKKVSLDEIMTKLGISPPQTI